MKNTLAVAVFGIALGLAGPAFAHTDLIKSIPAADSTVARPKTIILTFSEKVAPAFTGVALTMDDGMKYVIATAISPDGKIITVTPKGSLMAGGYKVTWHAAAAEDGHRTDGTFSFKIK
ncbi:MAG TPA: copper homeostasis periplasmic binding protein CopC [Rhizomicrobium sp.]|jgi:methionine-rich copper-binding protein CopC|nr:copper homeostasis periplasmic binding protein CopC [Rhizomicrobium sp.]